MRKKTAITTGVLATLALAATGVGISAAASSGSNMPFAHDAGMMGSGAGASGSGPMTGIMDSRTGASGAGPMTGMMGSGAVASGAGAMSGMMGSGGGKSGAMGMDFNSEFSYLTEMIPHHQEAVTTARIMLAGTNRPELKALARNIIQTQTEQIAQMKQWLAAWYPGRDTHVNYKPMMRDLHNLHGTALERAFLQDMIPHHWWAVWASQKLVAQGLATHKQLVPFAINGIRDPQAAQIHTMIGMLSQWFGESPMQAMAFMHN